MPILGPGDPLPRRPCRVVVAGTSGAGKTTTAKLVAAALGIRHHELDALFHGPLWQPRPEFEAEVRAFAAGPAWVAEWQYSAVKQHLADRADLMVWLDLPRRLVMRQVVTRTVVRRLRGTELWNGNREPALRTVLTDPGHIVRWAWASYPRAGAAVAELSRRRPDLPIVRLRRRSDLRRWVTGPLAAHRTDPAGGAA